MKRFGFGVRFAALLATIAAVIVLLVLVIGNRARKGRTGLPLDEETGLLGSAALVKLEKAYGNSLPVALRRLGLNRLDIQELAYQKNGYQLNQLLTWEEREFYVRLEMLVDKFNTYSITLCDGGEGATKAHAVEMADFWLAQATALYGEPLETNDPHNTLAQDEGRAKLQDPDFHGFLYAMWKIGDGTRFYINIVVNQTDEYDGCFASINYLPWKDNDLAFMSETW